MLNVKLDYSMSQEIVDNMESMKEKTIEAKNMD